jgi:2-Cys peroxiredoxin 5
MFARKLVVSGNTRQLSLNALRCYHASRPLFVNLGYKLPEIELVEDSPGNKVSLSKELKGKGLVIGVPAAFSKLSAYE